MSKSAKTVWYHMKHVTIWNNELGTEGCTLICMLQVLGLYAAPALVTYFKYGYHEHILVSRYHRQMRIDKDPPLGWVSWFACFLQMNNKLLDSFVSIICLRKVPMIDGLASLSKIVHRFWIIQELGDSMS